ncbi:MAG: recombinase family protein [Armatimonadota bacterium]
MTEAIETTTSGGKLVFHIFATLAEFERTLIRERERDDHTQSIQSICKTLE